MNKKTFDQFTDQFLKLMTIDPDMSIQRAAVLLTIAREDGLTQVQLMDRLNTTSASTSRHVAYWSALNRLKREGKGWIQYVEDPMDRRVKMLRLTEKGQSELAKLFA
jgi:DNA-binding MarR family transcriptional regulator